MSSLWQVHRVNETQLVLLQRNPRANTGTHIFSYAVDAHVSWRAEYLADWAMRKQLTQKSLSLPLPLISSSTPMSFSEVPPDAHFGWLKYDLTHQMWHPWRMMIKSSKNRHVFKGTSFTISPSRPLHKIREQFIENTDHFVVCRSYICLLLD